MTQLRVTLINLYLHWASCMLLHLSHISAQYFNQRKNKQCWVHTILRRKRLEKDNYEDAYNSTVDN